MRVLCTYCSASKDPAKGLIPAFKRYISPRIVRVEEMAEREECHFCILSGEFGLVDWDQPLPWYDHLLLAEQVPHLEQQVARQLTDKGITRLDYYTVSPQVDPKVIPYLNTIDKACASVGVELRVYTLEEPRLTSASRNWKQIMELAADARQTMIKDRKQGEAEFDKLLSLFPDDGMIFFERASGYEALGELAAAKADYELARLRFPLERWQWEAQEALKRIELELAAGGTLAEARRRVNCLHRLDASLRQQALSAIAKVGVDPDSAAVGLRICLESLVNRLLCKHQLQARGSIYSDMRQLESRVPDLVMNHMNTIRLIGNPAAHMPREDSKPLQATDVYPSVTALVAILEWWHAQTEVSR